MSSKSTNGMGWSKGESQVLMQRKGDAKSEWWIKATQYLKTREYREPVWGQQCALEGPPSKALWLFHLGRLQMVLKVFETVPVYFVHVYFEKCNLTVYTFSLNIIFSAFSISQVFIVIPFKNDFLYIAILLIIQNEHSCVLTFCFP